MRAALARQETALRGDADQAATLRFQLVRPLRHAARAGRDFIPVMLYRWRALNARQRAGIARPSAIRSGLDAGARRGSPTAG